MSAKKRKILATNALPYANGPIHLGHMLGSIQGDIWVRFQKMLGHDVLFICGDDSHGTPIMIKAEKLNITPEAMIQNIYQDHRQDFADFAIDFASFYTTHSPENKTLVDTIFKKHLAAGNINKRIIKQLFDPIKNIFLPDRYIKGDCPSCGSKDQYGDNCEVCGATYLPTDLKNPVSVLSGAKPIEKESEHYFFKLQNFETFLKEWTHEKGHLQEEVRNKLSEWFKEGLKEWDISRDSPYFGFNIPGEEHKYFYVWLDAPIGYMASFKHLCEQRKDLNFSEYWNPDSSVELYHFIGKDIIYFHALFWPAILKGAEYRTPNVIHSSGFLTVDGQKMSKSRGTFIKARTYLNHLPAEYLRYYYAAKLSQRMEDLDLQFDDFCQRVNSDLVGKFVNIASRCASFINKYFAGMLANNINMTLYQEMANAGDSIAKEWNNLNYNQAIKQIMSLADRANQYIDENKPWTLIKDETQKENVQQICSTGINLFRLLMIYLKPVLPLTAERAESFLNIAPLQWQDKDSALLTHKIRDFQPLMQRIDVKQITALKSAAQEDQDAKT